jgi:hypothetical protein
LPLDCLAAGEKKLEKRTEKGNVMNLGHWALLAGFIVAGIAAFFRWVWPRIRPTASTSFSEAVDKASVIKAKAVAYAGLWAVIEQAEMMNDAATVEAASKLYPALALWKAPSTESIPDDTITPS